MPVARGPRPLWIRFSGEEASILSNTCSKVNPCATTNVLEVRSYTRIGMRKRFRFRPPGLKPTTKVGTLGPYRGRLGFAWVIAPIFAGVAILLAGWLLLR